MNFKQSHKTLFGDTGSSNLFLLNASTMALIFLTIYVFNFGHIFADLLWHDDGVWYFAASQGAAIHNWKDNISAISVLSPYLNQFYAYGMLDWGLPATRSVFVLIMFLSTVSLYSIYKTIFGITSKVAFSAALIPQILPSLIGIPTGLNTSYAMWGLLPILISIQLIHQAVIKSGSTSYYFWLLSLAAYAIGLNLAISSTFLMPSVLFILAMFFLAGQNKSKIIMLVSPFLALSIWQLYRHILFSHLPPTQVPFHEVLERSIQFLEMGSFLPLNSLVSVYVTIFLILVGLAGLGSGSSQLFVKPAHFGFSELKYRIMLVAWPLVWAMCNSVAYVAASPAFRVNDYAYIFNFGIVLLQVCGIAYLWQGISSRLGWQERSLRLTLTLIFAGVIVFTGIQKLEYWNSTLKQNGFIETSSILRRHLQSLAIPANSQILVLDAETSHPGVFNVNSGYMRYLLGRKDVSALIGPDVFPNDIFVKSASWLGPMCNFNLQNPIIIFKKSGNKLTSKNLLLQVKSSGQEALPREQWALFDVSQPGYAPLNIASGLGMASFTTTIENQLPLPYTSTDIAFAPGDNPSIFLSGQQANESAKDRGLLDSEVNFNDIVTLRAVKERQLDSVQALELLLQVGSNPQKVKLGYRISNKEPVQRVDSYTDPVDGSVRTGINYKEPIQRVDMWGLAMYGDNILMKIAIPSSPKKTAGITFEFFDMSAWPYRPIPVKGKDNVSEIKL